MNRKTPFYRGTLRSKLCHSHELIALDPRTKLASPNLAIFWVSPSDFLTLCALLTFCALPITVKVSCSSNTSYWVTWLVRKLVGHVQHLVKPMLFHTLVLVTSLSCHCVWHHCYGEQSLLCQEQVTGRGSCRMVVPEVDGHGLKTFSVTVSWALLLIFNKNWVSDVLEK